METQLLQNYNEEICNESQNYSGKSSTSDGSIWHGQLDLDKKFTSIKETEDFNSTLFQWTTHIAAMDVCDPVDYLDNNMPLDVFEPTISLKKHSKETFSFSHLRIPANTHDLYSNENKTFGDNRPIDNDNTSSAIPQIFADLDDGVQMMKEDLKKSNYGQSLRTFSESESLDMHSGLPFEELKLDFGDLNVANLNPMNVSDDSLAKHLDMMSPKSEFCGLDADNFDLPAFIMGDSDILKNSPKKIKLMQKSPLKLNARSLEENLEIVNIGTQRVKTEVDYLRDETEEFVDVESLSDNESVPVLAAHNLDSLLEQFEATEQKVSSTPKKKHKVNLSIEDVKKKMASVEKSKLLAPKTQDSPPFHIIIPGTSAAESSNCGENNNTCLPSSNIVSLDHNYCSPSKSSPIDDKKSIILLEDPPAVKISNSKNNGKSVSSKITIYGNNKSVARSSQSLLKPIVQKELKMASLLQSSNSDFKKVSPIKLELISPKKSQENSIPFKYTLKKKLNLEEYKLRRGSSVRSCENSRTSSPITCATDQIAVSMPNSPIPSMNLDVKPLEENNLSEKLQSIADEVDETVLFDPIAKASKKAIQLKRAAIKNPIDDQIVRSKIPKVENLVILPLATENGKLLPMVKNMNDCDDEEIRQVERIIDPDYEEIVMVSIGINTDSPNPVQMKKEKDLVEVQKDVKFTANSLISSIKNELHKKTQQSLQDEIEDLQNVRVRRQSEHGENKIIMHLKKDRIKVESKSIAIQTEFIKNEYNDDEILLENNISNENWTFEYNKDNSNVYVKSTSRRSRSRSRRKTRRYRNNNSESCDRINVTETEIADDYPNETTDSGRNSRSDSSSSSYSSSSSSGGSSRSSSSCSSSSRSSYRSRSRSSSCFSRSHSPRKRRRSRRYSIRKNYRNGHNRKSIEERRTVFVGKLEQEITRKELASKFDRFGNIVEVTLHSKDDGSRYGFVTFSEALQCYQAVDKAHREPDLNKYDVSFGGRRTFCGRKYSDLDNLGALEDEEYFAPPGLRLTEISPVKKKVEEPSFDRLLQEMLKRKKVK